MSSQKFESYKASVTKEILEKWHGSVRIWDRPQSAVQGAEVIDEISKPTAVTVVEEQIDMYGGPQRAKVVYRKNRKNQEGWILYHMIAKK